MAISTGKLQRSMKHLTIGTVKRMDAKRQDRIAEGLAEREEQFKIPVAGRGEEFPEWVKVELEFESVFVDATGQRHSDFEQPIITYGYTIERGGPVGVDVCLTEWNVNDRNETIGCVLWVGARATDIARKFRGEVHVIIQGYGMPPAPYGDIPDSQ